MIVSEYLIDPSSWQVAGSPSLLFSRPEGFSRSILQPIASPSDRYDFRLVQEAVEDSRRRRHVADQLAPILQGAIGVTDSGVEGVDIQVPAYHFTETHFMYDAQVTPAYKLSIFATTGCVNDDWFRGYAPGELLFLGASGAKRGSEQWELTFRFSALPNQSNIKVGNITGITKYGWDYLWVQYEDDVDEQATKLIKKPTSAYVEQVYPAALFSINLGIGA